MTWFHALQLAYWTIALVFGGRLVKALLFDARLALRPIQDAVEERLPQDLPAARAFLASAEPAWIARVGCAYLAPPGEAGEGGVEGAAEIADALRAQSVRAVGSLITMGRIASPLAFLGAILELTGAFGGGEGLEALQRGLPEQLALGRAATGITIGVMTMLFCFSLSQILSRQVRDLTSEVGRMQEALGRALASPGPGT